MSDDLSTDTSAASQAEADLLAGEDLFGQGDVDAALEVFLNIIAAHPRHAGAHSNLGVAYWEIGERYKAVQHLREAFRLNSNDRTTALNLGKALSENGQFEAAIHTLATFLYLNPDDAEARALLETCQAHEAAQRAQAAEQASLRTSAATPLPRRYPDAKNALQSLLALGIEINSILDVGIHHGTPPLMQCFPHHKHYLFEPIDEHFDLIRRNYEHMNYDLQHVALSNSDGEAWQVGESLKGGSTVTHSHLSDVEVSKEQNPNLISCKKIRKARLDSLVAALKPMPPYLLKIDVDGHEIPILQGATEALKQASVVVMEVTAATLIPRGQVLTQQGFQLFDIVDFNYYCDLFYQADVIFVRADIIADNPDLRPMQQGAFQPDRWQSLTAMFKA